MKFLFINVVCGIRSTGRICTDLALALEEQGHKVRIAYGREKVPEEYKKYAVRIGNDVDVFLHGVKARLFDRCGFGSKRATTRFIQWVEEYDPDIIHLHNLHGYYVNIEILFDYIKRRKKRVVWTLHDCWAFTGHSAYCDSVDCTRWEEGCHHCPLKGEYPRSLSDGSKRNWVKKKSILQGISGLHLVTPSKWLKEQAEKSFLSQYMISVINNGIDLDVFRPVKSDFKKKYGLENRFVIVSAATAWSKMKGYDDFVWLAEHLDDSYKIVLVGLSDKQIKLLPHCIKGIERTNNTHELAAIYCGADAYVCLSHCENYPTVILEAEACGLPVITYDVGGCSEAAGARSVVVNKGDYKRVLTLLNQRKTTSSGRTTIGKIRGVDDVLLDYIDLYNSL